MAEIAFKQSYIVIDQSSIVPVLVKSLPPLCLLEIEEHFPKVLPSLLAFRHIDHLPLGSPEYSHLTELFQ